MGGLSHYIWLCPGMENLEPGMENLTTGMENRSPGMENHSPGMEDSWSFWMFKQDIGMIRFDEFPKRSLPSALMGYMSCFLDLSELADIEFRLRPCPRYVLWVPRKWFFICQILGAKRLKISVKLVLNLKNSKWTSYTDHFLFPLFSKVRTK